jgi:glycosyltransferase involved in cell wall biosynthesis
LAGERFRVSFIAPHQRRAAGGVYSIQQFASNLARWMDVHLIVRAGDLQPLPGVSVIRSETLAPDTIPDADATILHINAPDAEPFFSLPQSKGERLLLFQGYSVLGSEMVKERLGSGLRVMAISRWLVEEGRRLGADVSYTPIGLDRSIFFPGPPTEDRGATVAVKSHPAKWKGTADGFAALEQVARARPGAEIVVFGVRPPAEPPRFPHSFASLQTQSEVASLFRETALFVCPSWEEGFGMPGLEALACGSALATTDTKGSRDYAFHEKTALVSPPRRPEMLAENVVRLLDDAQLRRRLCDEGERCARTEFGPWAEAAARIRDVLLSRAQAPSTAPLGTVGDI